MNIIIKIGMDVHTTNFTLCLSEPQLGGEPNVLLITKIKPDVDLLVDVINTFTNKYPSDEFDITCGYEAGCLGFVLYHQIVKKGYK